MSDDPIDFTPLDPKQNPARFEQMVRAVVAGARVEPRRFLLTELVRVGWVAVFSAALLAGVAWIPVLSRQNDEPGHQASEDPVTLMSEWAQQGQVPAGVDPLQALGRGLHGQ